MELQQETMPEIPEDFPIPLQSGVIIKRCRLAIEDKIYVPQSSSTPTNEGFVMAIGPELKGMIEVGQKVLFNSKANLWLLHNEVEYLACHESDVYAKVVRKSEDEEVLVPFNKTVLVRKGQEEIKMASGIILPDNQKLINYGNVLGVGHAVNPQITVGKKVVFNIYANFKYMFRGREVYCMSEVDILILLPNTTFAGTADLGRERRTDIDLDKLPEVAPKKKLTGKKIYYDKKD